MAGSHSGWHTHHPPRQALPMDSGHSPVAPQAPSAWMFPTLLPAKNNPFAIKVYSQE